MLAFVSSSLQAAIAAALVCVLALRFYRSAAGKRFFGGVLDEASGRAVPGNRAKPQAAALLEADGERKLESHKVPPLGGLAIAVAIAILGLIYGRAAVAGAAPFVSLPLALGAAWLAGFIDDRRPLGPGPKLLLQVLVVLLAVVPGGLGSGFGSGFDSELGGGGGAFELILWSLGALVAMNVANTFDNADGATTGVAALGLLLAGRPSCGALLGFLPFNLLCPAGRRARGPVRAPHAYLGDGGSQLVGLLLWCDPVARFALLLPALDLLGTSLRRLRAGQAPWRGDRRHLAHDLQRRGLGAYGVLCVLLVLSLPGSAFGALGVGVSVLLYLATGHPWRKTS